MSRTSDGSDPRTRWTGIVDSSAADGLDHGADPTGDPVVFLLRRELAQGGGEGHVGEPDELVVSGSGWPSASGIDWNVAGGALPGEVAGRRSRRRPELPIPTTDPGAITVQPGWATPARATTSAEHPPPTRRRRRRPIDPPPPTATASTHRAPVRRRSASRRRVSTGPCSSRTVAPPRRPDRRRRTHRVRPVVRLQATPDRGDDDRCRQRRRDRPGTG